MNEEGQVQFIDKHDKHNSGNSELTNKSKEDLSIVEMNKFDENDDELVEKCNNSKKSPAEFNIRSKNSVKKINNIKADTSSVKIDSDILNPKQDQIKIENSETDNINKNESKEITEIN